MGDISHLIVDRDGVLNVEADEGWVTEPSAWRWIPGSREALVGCAELGIEVSVVTNQSVIGRGLVDRHVVDGLHRWVLDDVRAHGGRIDRMLVCPHGPDDGCACRKPAPGLVLDAVAAADVPPARSLLVGDAARDLLAGAAAGVRAVLVRTGKGARTAEAPTDTSVEVFDDLAAVVRSLR